MLILPLSRILPAVFALFLFGAAYSCKQEAKHTDTTQVDQLDYDSLRLVLEEIHDTDQGIRERMHQQDSFSSQLFGEMLLIDSTNHRQVVGLLDEYGWLPASKIGSKASEALFYVLQHGDDETMAAYLPILKQQVAVGEANAEQAAMMEDRVLMSSGKRQKYGTQVRNRIDPDSPDVYYVWPVEDPSFVDARRQAVGFKLTVQENADRLEAIYDTTLQLPTARIQE